RRPKARSPSPSACRRRRSRTLFLPAARGRCGRAVRLGLRRDSDLPAARERRVGGYLVELGDLLDRGVVARGDLLDGLAATRVVNLQAAAGSRVAARTLVGLGRSD